MKAIRVVFIFFIFLKGVFSSDPSVSFSEEFKTGDAKQGWYTDSWASSITTWKKETFFVYVDSTLHAVVGKITEGQVIRVLLDSTHLVTDDGHNEFSIAFDKKGILHVVGDMHNDSLRYWRSKAAYSITSGFTKVTNAIPGTFSYYYFRKSNTGDLFLSARAGAGKVWYKKGGRGIGLYKYDIATEKWEMRGALAPDGDFPVIFWENSGTDTSSYQMYKSDLRFDKNDGLHFTTTVNVNDVHTTCNYAVYAFSDDYGITWKRCDGSAISLPMNKSNTDGIDGYENAAMGEHSRLLLDRGSRPAVVYSIDNKTFYRYLQDAAWQPRIEIVNNGQWGRMETLYDNNGGMKVINGSTILLLDTYGGGCFTIKNASASIYRWDFDALRHENVYRGIEWSSSSGTWRIMKATFSGVSTIPSIQKHNGSTPGLYHYRQMEKRHADSNGLLRNVSINIVTLSGRVCPAKHLKAGTTDYPDHRCNGMLLINLQNGNTSAEETRVILCK